MCWILVDVCSAKCDVLIEGILSSLQRYVLPLQQLHPSCEEIVNCFTAASRQLSALGQPPPLLQNIVEVLPKQEVSPKTFLVLNNVHVKVMWVGVGGVRDGRPGYSHPGLISNVA